MAKLHNYKAMPNLATINSALYGEFRLTGVYSIELRFNTEFSIYEFPFLIPPESYSCSEPWRADLAKTLRGGYLADYGNDFKDFTVSGECWFYYAGAPRYPFSTDISGGIGSAIDGYSEFLKLRFLLVRFRDYLTLDRDSQVRAPRFTLKELAIVELFRSELELLIAKGRGGLSDQIQLIWHAYDFDDHWAVKLDAFDWRITKDDPFTVFFDIKMQGYEVDPTRTGLVRTRGARKVAKKSYPEKIREVHNLSSTAHAASQPTELTVSTASGEYAVTSRFAEPGASPTVVVP